MDGSRLGHEAGQATIPHLEDVPARRASRSVLAVVGLRVAGAGLGVLVAGILTRHLGPRRFGELSLILAVAILASSIGELGTTQVVVGEMAARPERRAELAAGFAWLRAVAGAVLAAAGALVLVLVLVDDASARRTALAVMATVPLAGLTGLVVLAQARLRPELAAALSLGQSILWVTSVAVVAALDLGLAWYGLAFLACALAQAVVTWLLVGRPERPQWQRRRAAARWIVRRSWPLALATVLGTVYYRLDSVLVFRWAGPEAAGFYAAGYRFLDVFQIVPAAIISVAVPVLAHGWSRADRSRVERVFRLALTLAGAVSVPAVVATLVLSDRLASAVFGSRFAPAGSVVRVLGLGFFSIATGYVYSAALVATGRVKVVAAVSAAAVVASIAADAVVIPRWGATGAAWVTVAVEYLVSSSLAVWIHRQYRLGMPWDRFRSLAVAAACMAAVALASRDTPLAVVVGAGAAVYVAAAASLGAVTEVDVRSLTDNRLPLGST